MSGLFEKNKHEHVYLEGEVDKGVHCPPIGSWGGERSAHAAKHGHLLQIQAVLLQIVFIEHAGILLQHFQGHPSQLYHQVFIISGPFLSAKNTRR